MQLFIIQKSERLLACLILLASCGESAGNKDKSTSGDTALSNQPANQITSRIERGTGRDTTITYSIDGLSAEGSELQAHYIRDTIKEVTWRLYGETGQSEIKYLFLNKVVMAEEKDYVYEQSITEVTDQGDIKLKSQRNYVLDTSGKLITKIDDPDFVNVFNDMKAQVPFVLQK